MINYNKNMRKIAIMALLLSLITFEGCEKKLNIVPTFFSPEELALSSTSGMDAGLSTAYGYIYGELGLTFTLWSELMADHLYFQGTSTNYANFYNRDLNSVIAEQVSPIDPRIVNDIVLRQMYDGVNSASLILRGIDRGYANKDISFAANKTRIQGECHFLRAVGYFEMARFWARAWNATADNSHPGIVINTVPVDDRVSQIKPRASLAEVYAFIIDDLTQAINLLPDAYDPTIHPAVYNGRAYKDAAIAYLVKVYFQQQNYTKAKPLIDQLIGSSAGTLTKHPLNSSVTAPFTTRGPSNQDPENIIQNTCSLNVNGLSPFWYSAIAAIYNSTLAASSLQGYASNAFIQNSKFRGTDQRRINWFKTYPTGQLLPQKYSLALQINIPLVRSAEMVLDRAEIYALANDLPNAILDCNVTRARAQIPLLPPTITQSSLIDSIKTERIRELCFEGDRLWNLKRQQLPIPPGDRAGAVVLPWDGVDLVLKYAALEMSLNPSLVNNY